MRSASISGITAALIKAQLVMPNAQMNKENPHFHSRYADLTSLRDASLKILNDNGLAITHGGDLRDGKFVMVASLMHGETGEWIESIWPMPEGATAQQYGSANTYAKRYTWAGLLGISSEEDDDANAAEEIAPPPKARAVKPVKDEVPKPPPAIEPPVNPETGVVEPHAIPWAPTKLGIGSDSIAWSQLFLAAIGTGTTDLEISAWEKANVTTLIAIEAGAPIVVKRLRAAILKNYERVSTNKGAYK